MIQKIQDVNCHVLAPKQKNPPKYPTTTTTTATTRTTTSTMMNNNIPNPIRPGPVRKSVIHHFSRWSTEISDQEGTQNHEGFQEPLQVRKPPFLLSSFGDWNSLMAFTSIFLRVLFEPQGMVYRHPLSSIQHPLEDPGIYIYIHGLCQKILFYFQKKRRRLSKPTFFMWDSGLDILVNKNLQMASRRIPIELTVG